MAFYSSPNSPGDWRSFLKRNDIRNLLFVCKNKRKNTYIEQLQFDDFVSQQAISQTISF